MAEGCSLPEAWLWEAGHYPAAKHAAKKEIKLVVVAMVGGTIEKPLGVRVPPVFYHKGSHREHLFDIVQASRAHYTRPCLWFHCLSYLV